MEENQIRSLNQPAQLRAEQTEEKKIIRGYPIIFNSPGDIGGGWTEVIERSALDGVDLSQVKFLAYHDKRYLIGKAGINMRCEIDDTGLFVEVEVPNTQMGNDIYELVSRGILDTMSFAFLADEIESDNVNKRDTIKKFRAISEVSLEPFPAYKNTVAMARSEQEEPQKNDSKKEALLKYIQNL